MIENVRKELRWRGVNRGVVGTEVKVGINFRQWRGFFRRIEKVKVIRLQTGSKECRTRIGGLKAGRRRYVSSVWYD